MRQKAAWLNRVLLLELRWKRKVYGQGKHHREEHREAACCCREKICAARAQFEVNQNCRGKEKVSSNALVAKGCGEVTSASYRMRVVTSPRGTQTRQVCLLQSLPPSSPWISDQESLSVLSCRTTTVRMTSSLLTLNTCGICCSILTNPGSTAGPLQTHWEIHLPRELAGVIAKPLWTILSALGNLERSQLPGGCK